MVLRLEEFRAQRQQYTSDHEGLNGAYARLFAEFGIDVESLSPPEVAARIAGRPATAVRVAAALDDWAQVLRNWGLRDQTRDPATWKRLLEVARLADPDPWRSQLRQLMGQEDLKALRKLAEAADMTALPVQSLLQMGNALIFGGDGPACVAWLRKAHREHPGDPLISFGLAFHLSHLPSADWVEVLRFAEAGLAARPNPHMYDFVGNVLNKLDRHDEAVAVCRKAIELKPDFDGAHNHLGIALARQGKLDEAIPCYRKAIELKPDFAWAHNNLGEALAAQDKLDEAIVCYRKCIELSPKWSWAHANLGNALGKQGKPDEAAAAYREAIRLNPDDHNAHRGLGVVLGKQGKLDEAVAAYRDAIRLKPDDQTAQTNLAAVLRQARLDEAIGASRTAVELNPTSFSTHSGLGDALSAKGDTDGAIAAYREAIELDPKQASTYDRLGNVLWMKKDFDGAIAAYRTAIELNPKSFSTHNRLGGVLSAKGDTDGAVAAYREVIRLQPDDHTAHYNLGVSLGKQGDVDAAIGCYRKVIEVNPKFAAAHRNLARACAATSKTTTAPSPPSKKPSGLNPTTPQRVSSSLRPLHSRSSGIVRLAFTQKHCSDLATSYGLGHGMKRSARMRFSLD